MKMSGNGKIRIWKKPYMKKTGITNFGSSTLDGQRPMDNCPLYAGQYFLLADGQYFIIHGQYILSDGQILYSKGILFFYIINFFTKVVEILNHK